MEQVVGSDLSVCVRAVEQVVGSDLSVCVSVLWSRSSGGRLAQEWAASPRSAPGDPPLTHQRDVIVHRDNTGYGFTVSGDTPVSVLSVKLGEWETTARLPSLVLCLNWRERSVSWLCFSSV